MSFLIFFFFLRSYANTWPAWLAENGTLKISNNTMLSQYVSVEQEILVFEWKLREGIDESEGYYPWEQYFLERYKDNPKILEYISENTVDGENWLGDQAKTSIKFYNINWYKNIKGYFQVKVKYVLRNNSSNYIPPQKVVFSSLKPSWMKKH